MKWAICYKRAIQDDGSLLFPERLSKEFLDNARRTMGSYLFANQYQNEIIPDGETPFKKEWIKYYDAIPSHVHTFCFIDPAISQADTADFTACVVVSVDTEKNWYVRSATRHKVTPSQIVNLVFRLQEKFAPMCIGIEDVAYQKALLYMIDEEMRRRGTIAPVRGIHPGTSKTKEMRIMGLVPRFEWGHIYMNRGLHDFELEYAQFPRSAHDDLLDALAYIEQICVYPEKEKFTIEEPHSPSDPRYESWYIHNRHKMGQGEEEGYE